VSTGTRGFAGDPEFHELCRQFRALEARKAVDEASASFAQAHLIRDARVRLRAPVATLCEALDLSAQSVHTYRNVAERIDEPLFRELVGARGSGGLTLFPWSIIVQVARLARKEERDELIEKIRLHEWRTRAVAAYLSLGRGDAARLASDLGLGDRGRRHRSGGDLEGTRVPPPATSAVLGSPLATLMGGLSRARRPAVALVTVADVASRLIARASRESDRERASLTELWAARDALTRCALVVFGARSSIERRLSELCAELDPERCGSEARSGRGEGTDAARREAQVIDVRRRLDRRVGAAP
jgi:hypothetical protein